MKILWVDGNLTFKPETDKDVGLIGAIDAAIKNYQDQSEPFSITGTWTNIPEDAIRIAR